VSTTAELLKGAAELFPDEVVTRAHVRHLDLPFGAGRFALITLDNGLDHTKPTTFGPQSLANLDTAIDQVEKEAAAGEIVGVGITGKPFIFAVGADLKGVELLKEHKDALAIGKGGHEVFKRLSGLGVPTFAYYNGAAMGGGVEVGLHCAYRTVSAALPARRDARLAPVLSLAIWKTRPATLRRLTGLGTPIAATYGSEAGFFFVVALFAGSFGTAALAAHTAVNQLVYIVFQIAVGLSHAASIGVSRELALHNLAAAQRLKTTALACAAAVMAVVALVYMTVPQLVLAPFFDTGDHRAIEIATQLLLVAAVLQFFDCAQNIGVGLLRGLDDTKGGFHVTLVGYWLVGLPAAALLGLAIGLDTLGIWLGLLTGLATTAVLLLRRFNRGLGRLPRTTEPTPS
jgi:hypothetical protein